LVHGVTVRPVVTAPLTAIGWNDRWASLLAEHGADAEPGRVLRHDGVAVQVRTPAGDRTVKLRRGVDAVTVGDWLVVDGEQVVALLPRSSLLRRRAAGGDDQQLLAANLDLVLLVCGLDRPLTAGRIQRGEALAWDAGAHPILVLTKADMVDEVDTAVSELDAAHPGLERLITSSVTGRGIPDLRARMAGATSVLLGESGAGKSRLVNALLGSEAAVVGAVRSADAKGRHTTTNRQLHLLPDGGVVIDSPGIREVGLAGDEESVDATFADLDELGEECRFSDCSHTGEPGCAIALAIDAGEITQDRLDAYLELRAEAIAAARRADEHANRAHQRRFSKTVKSYLKNKPNTKP
jgi:ribosome biogenesis GTPase